MVGRRDFLFAGAGLAAGACLPATAALAEMATSVAKPAQAVSVHLAAVLADGYAAAAEAVIVCLPKDRQPYRLLVWSVVRPPSLESALSPAG